MLFIQFHLKRPKTTTLYPIIEGDHLHRKNALFREVVSSLNMKTARVEGIIKIDIKIVTLLPTNNFCLTRFHDAHFARKFKRSNQEEMLWEMGLCRKPNFPFLGARTTEEDLSSKHRAGLKLP